MPDTDPRSSRPTDVSSPSLRTRAGRLALDLAGRLLERHPVLLEYPPPDDTQPRPDVTDWPNPALSSIVAGGADRYRQTLGLIAEHAADLGRIPLEPGEAGQPHWNQDFFTGLDAATLYALIRDRRPALYCEVGSGNSTLFAARAIRDGGLPTRTVCFDPAPRAEIDGICDRLVRRPFDTAHAEEISALRGGDILLIDSSHVVLQNSDVVALVLSVLPQLPPDVLVGVHDIFLPDDYPWWLSGRGYGEQYLLGAWLLGARPVDRLVMACHYCATEPGLRSELEAMWKQRDLPRSPYGSALWFTS